MFLFGFAGANGMLTFIYVINVTSRNVTLTGTLKVTSFLLVEIFGPKIYVGHSGPHVFCNSKTT